MSEDEDDVQKAMGQLSESGKFPEFIKKLDQLTEKLSVPGPDEVAFFEERRRKGLGVGLDDDGNLVNAAVGRFSKQTVADIPDEIQQDARGLDELDRGESVDLEEVLEKARAIVEGVERTRSQEDE